MNVLHTVSYIFRKYPLARLFVVCGIGVLITVGTIVVGLSLKQKPYIEAVQPPIGAPGDTVTLRGKNFGNHQDTSYVEIGGSRLTRKSYRSWSDTEIRLTLPENVQNGLVIVGTAAGRSQPLFFANKDDIPRPASADTHSAQPVIAYVAVSGGPTVFPTSTAPLRVKPGDVLTISGSNFGNTADNADVLFSATRKERTDATAGPRLATKTVSLPADKDAADYLHWSNTEIRVSVPDGVSDGTLTVVTPHGASDPVHVVVSSPVGTKQFVDGRTYLIEVNADISDVTTERSAVITLRMPRPRRTAMQPSVELNETIPEPIIADFQQTLIFQTPPIEKTAPGRMTFTARFIVPVFETLTTIQADRIGSYDSMNSALYAATTHADALIPATDARIVSLAAEIVGRERNPYRKARLLYNYLIDTYTIVNEVRGGDISIVDLLTDTQGDAYDFALVYTALLRAAQIPAVPVSGVLVDRTIATRNHWWVEFYLPEFGWVPVDPALAAGLSYTAWTDIENPREYYFGNLDAQHILFSRGWNDIKPASANSVTVQLPRTYALQSIWEETTTATMRYNSLWNTPIVRGVY
ncbi:MAG: IPT/TIG domain-containing protein [Treponema sp.]|nr:IPT/TIG domain-containing protein [Treponema sp.]